MCIGRLFLPEGIREEIKAHAMEDCPAECCGLLFGSLAEDGSAETAHACRMQNQCTESKSRCHYRMDPLEIHHAEEYYAKQGLELIGFYHSHPDHPAETSAEDLREMIPETVYLIVSAMHGECTEMKAWIRGGDNNESSNIRNIEIFF